MTLLIDVLRSERNKLINRQQFNSAIYLSDKIISFRSHTEADIFILAKCFYRLKEYQRAAYVIEINDLHHTDIACGCLAVKCLYKCKEHSKALELIEIFLEGDHVKSQTAMWKIPLLVTQSSLYEAIDNRKSARDSLFKVLDLNFPCYEAFNLITSHHMISKAEEINLLNTIITNNKSTSPFMCAFMRFFYYIQLKKYDKPAVLKMYSPFEVFERNNYYLVALAERHYYNFNFNSCLNITSSLLKDDPYNFQCLTFHILCLMEFEKIDEIFALAQDLINKYPFHEVSWFAIGTYYHMANNVELSRRFLLKSITLNDVFATGWLLYGHSFSEELEHDQAITAFFKAITRMPGCHLPLVYIGVEYILTENQRLGEKFITHALLTAPEDPIALHELSIIAFYSKEYLKAEKNLRSALSILNSSNISMPKQYETMLNNMGHILRKLGRYMEAVDYFEKSIEIFPLVPSSYCAIGMIFSLMAKWKEAVVYLDKAHAINRLLQREDTSCKALLDDAMKNFAENKVSYYSFNNTFDNPKLVETLSNQTPKTCVLNSSNDSMEMSLETSRLSLSSSSVLDSSFRI